MHWIDRFEEGMRERMGLYSSGFREYKFKPFVAFLSNIPLKQVFHRPSLLPFHCLLASILACAMGTHQLVLCTVITHYYVPFSCLCHKQLLQPLKCQSFLLFLTGSGFATANDLFPLEVFSDPSALQKIGFLN